MNIRLVNNSDIPQWMALSREYDCYVRELVADLTEWYDGNETSPAFGDYMDSKIKKQEALMAVDTSDGCLGIIAISIKNNRITFFAVSHKSDFQSVGSALMKTALEKLDGSKPISINEIISTSPQIQKFRDLFLDFEFTYSCDSIKNGVPVETFVKTPLRFSIDEIKTTLGQMLDAKRLAHTFAVCDTAVVLAERFGADKNKAYLAALVHDCARGLDGEQLKTYCNEHGIELDDYMKNDINPVHSLVGADMAKRRFGIDDEEIISAIKNHAVGCENMTLLDKIILVADAIEPHRTGSDADEARNAAENDIDEAIVPVMRIKSYYLQGKSMHPNSSMMLNKLSETKLYFDWVQKVCDENNITINGKMTHIKDGKLFCISSSIGDLYLKKAGSFIIDELTFTLKLMALGLVSLPEWIGYDHDMNVCLMRDMGGCDLSLLPTLDMQTSQDMIISLSRLQKDSIPYVESKDICGVDYRIGTMLEELEGLPETAYTMLSDTQYRITRDETEKLKRNAEHIKTVLESIKKTCLPDTIHHGDLGTYNVRVIDGKSIFYDWGCGGISHPFFDTFRLLSSIRGKLPADVPAKDMILDTYLGEWLEYGSREELKNIFTTIDGLAGFYMAYVKYIRTRDVHLSFANNMEAIAAHCLEPNNRYATASTYLKRFIANEF